MCQDKARNEKQLGVGGELLGEHEVWITDMTQE